MPTITESAAALQQGMKSKIEIVQVWRFFAAALVVAVHSYSRIARTFPESV
jgi:peptidoglycan/LPS O-acetylase OafA/YrhL